ncbi:MAG TPA: hypothetical protein VFO30_03600, partial [Chthoniobacterales bacterium]|nr:hypothetical protein [Chthoniobacterales bacterium]
MLPYSNALDRAFHSFPETTFSFQITSPTEMFGGMVLKSWGVRKSPTAIAEAGADAVTSGAHDKRRHGLR